MPFELWKPHDTFSLFLSVVEVVESMLSADCCVRNKFMGFRGEIRSFARCLFGCRPYRCVSISSEVLLITLDAAGPGTAAARLWPSAATRADPRKASPPAASRAGRAAAMFLPKRPRRAGTPVLWSAKPGNSDTPVSQPGEAKVATNQAELPAGNGVVPAVYLDMQPQPPAIPAGRDQAIASDGP